MTFTLYDYQIAAVNAAMASISAKRNDLIVAPTGSGKSVCIAEIVKRILPSKQRILIVSHVREILTQVADHLTQHIPGIDFGIYCAGLRKMEPGKQVIIGSIHSLYRRSYWRGFDVVIVDEAHAVGRKENSMYQQLFAFLRRASDSGTLTRDRKLPIIGFSATPYRLDTGYLHQGPGALFDRIAYEAPIKGLVDRGILAPLTTREVTQIDFSDLPVHAGDYVVQAFEERTEWLAETARSLAITRRLAEGRKKWLIYACSVKHCLAIAEMLNADGVSCIAVHHKLSKQERDEALRAYRDGECRALVTVNCLTTGFDYPAIDCIVQMRPTLSTGLHIQMLGRGMRAAPGKTDCGILDFSGNIARHGAMTDIIPEVREPEIEMSAESTTSKRSLPSTKLCPTCGDEIHARMRQCGNCGKLFVSIAAKPAQLDPLYPSEPEEEVEEASPREGSNYPLYLEPDEYGNFQYRRRVPMKLRAMVGKPHWHLSLKTKDEERARKLSYRLSARYDRLIAKLSGAPQTSPPPSSFAYLSTEEAAALMGVSPRYLKQMRGYGTSPAYYAGGASTQLGWRLIVYRQEDVEAWRNRRTYIRGKDGRTWRLTDNSFQAPQNRVTKSNPSGNRDQSND